MMKMQKTKYPCLFNITQYLKKSRYFPLIDWRLQKDQCVFFFATYYLPCPFKTVLCDFQNTVAKKFKNLAWKQNKEKPIPATPHIKIEVSESSTGPTSAVSPKSVGATQAQQPVLLGAACPFWKYGIYHAPWSWLPNSATDEEAELCLRSLFFFFFLIPQLSFE